MQNALVLGTFDGLHSGHRAVINSADGYSIIAVTFYIPPKAFISDNCGMIMPYEMRVAALKELGVSQIFSLDFNQVKDIPPVDFLEKIFLKYEPELICCGYNYRFGKDAAGDVDTLKNFCFTKNIKFHCSERVTFANIVISSTQIRDLIKNGMLIDANKFLYKDFGFFAEVVNGDHRGTTIGFPTINQAYPDDLVIPKFGVYASKTVIDGVEYNSISNIGIRPTFRTKRIMCETHILNFSGNLYGKRIFLKPKSFLREEKKFTSTEALKKAISNDIACIKTIGEY